MLYLVLLANIRLDWKRLPMTNTLDYYNHLQIMAVKSFITLALEPGLVTIIFVKISLIFLPVS